jgi:hypothetical protein
MRPFPFAFEADSVGLKFAATAQGGVREEGIE